MGKSIADFQSEILSGPGTYADKLLARYGVGGGGGGTGADGKSAYELAVQQGYVGDLNSWLSSLVGPTGATGAAGANAGTVTSNIITVASATASTATKNAANFVCDGTDDQVEINQALALASRSADGFSGDGRGVVVLMGPRFFVANDNATCITMYPSTHLTGFGWSTVITPMWASTAADRGAIELLNADTAHVLVSDLWIGRHNAVVSNGHGIKFVNNGSAAVYEVKTGADTYNQIRNVATSLMSRSGFYVTGTSGGNREAQINHCLAWSAGERGFYIDSSDCQISDCRATGGGNFPRFEIAGGNTKVANCKAYFSGNRIGDGSTADGFLISSSRISITGCDAQDNGRWGFRFTGGDVTATGLVADSNSRSTTLGGGFSVEAPGCYTGMHAYNRPQTPASPQQFPLVFSGSPNVYYTGKTGITDTLGGAVHVTGNPGPNSYARVVREGSTIYSFG